MHLSRMRGTAGAMATVLIVLSITDTDMAGGITATATSTGAKRVEMAVHQVNVIAIKRGLLCKLLFLFSPCVRGKKR